MIWREPVSGYIDTLYVFFEGPVISVIMHKIGTWRTQMIAAMLLIGSSIATSLATQYWHVIISYAIIEGRGEAQ